MRNYVQPYMNRSVRQMINRINRFVRRQYPNDHNLRRLRRRDLRKYFNYELIIFYKLIL